MKDGVILRVNKPARMGIDDASLYPCSLACRAACVRRCYEKQACYEIGCYENGTRGSLAGLFPLATLSPCCLPRGLRSALLRKASVLRNWLLRKWDARQPSSAFSRSQHFPECNGPRYLLEQRRIWLMLQSRVLLHCCVLRMCAETNFSHPIPEICC